MPKHSAGLLMYRRAASGIEVLLVHPGGPFWAKKDLGAWSIPKGEYQDDESPLDAARREFQEETGFPVSGTLIDLGTITQTSGKLVTSWAFEGDCDPTAIVTNTCEIEWPPRSNHYIKVPDVDRAAWFSVQEASAKLAPKQVPFLSRLLQTLDSH
jgi:predicted NUDIX family NTP pyrophosphohydrolase